MSKLIINEHPLLVLPSLAIAIGLNEAIILQQVHYWLDPRINKNIINGMPWVYNTYSRWAEQFPFWSEITIRRTIKSLEEKNLLISDNFNKNSFSNQKWYTINYDNLNKISNSFALSEKSLFKNSNTSTDQIDHVADQFASIKRSKRSHKPIKLIRSYIETETTTETTTNNSLSIKPKKKITISSSSQEVEEERECKMLKIWNEVVETKFGREVKITPKRKLALGDRLKEFFNNDMNSWEKFCQYILESKFLMGEVKDFRVSLDWILKEDFMIKAMEGTYHREGPSKEKETKEVPVEEDVEQILKQEIQTLNAPEFWKEILRKLLHKKGVNIFKAWFVKNQFYSFKEGVLEIKAPSKFFANWQIDNFLDDIFEVCKQTLSNFEDCKIIY